MNKSETDTAQVKSLQSVPNSSEIEDQVVKTRAMSQHNEDIVKAQVSLRSHTENVYSDYTEPQNDN